MRACVRACGRAGVGRPVPRSRPSVHHITAKLQDPSLPSKLCYTYNPIPSITAQPSPAPSSPKAGQTPGLGALPPKVRPTYPLQKNFVTNCRIAPPQETAETQDHATPCRELRSRLPRDREDVMGSAGAVAYAICPCPRQRPRPYVLTILRYSTCHAARSVSHCTPHRIAAQRIIPPS